MGSKSNETKNYPLNKRKKLYPIIFKWEGEAEKVYLTGSFCDWITFYEMEKNENEFFFTLFLEKGIYQYKFKVDSIWKCNNNFPTCNDKNGNVNNYINVIEKKIEEITTDFSTSSISDNKEDICLYNSFEELSKIFNKTEEKIHKEDTYDMSRNNFSNDEELDKEEDALNNFNNHSFKQVSLVRNEFIDHLNVKQTCSKSKNPNCIISSCSIRLKFKIATFVYYKPKPV